MEDFMAGMGYCGLVCTGCPIFLAAREPDPDRRKRMRAKIARICNAEYGSALTPEEITGCDGCRTPGGRIFSSCARCGIRRCAGESGFETCAGCSRYACEKLEQLFRTDPAAKTRLEVIRAWQGA
ncbi:MAG: DUF3795 domain-containing protein [Candidatus Latescibacterota bacterium]